MKATEGYISNRSKRKDAEALAQSMRNKGFTADVSRNGSIYNVQGYRMKRRL